MELGKNMAVPGNTLTFAGGTTSTSLPIPGANMNLVALLFPSTWSSATLTIQGSFDGVNFYNIFSSSLSTPGVLTFTSFGASQILALRIDDFTGIPYVRLTSGSSQTCVITAQFRSFQ